ncbi:MAG: ABC transporter transmembrane domain-containing protein [Chitinophagales bacterium]
MKSYLRILRIAVRYRRYAFLNLTFNVLYAVFNLFSILSIIPFLQVIFNTVTIPEQQPVFAWNIKAILGYFNYAFGNYVAEHGSVAGLVIICFFIVLVFLLKNICRYLALYFIAPLRNGVVRDLRQSLYDKVMMLPLAFFSEKKKGDIIARMTTDVNEVEWSIMSTIEATFRDPITMLFFFAAMLLLSFQLTIFVIVLLPVTGFIIGTIGKSLKRKSKKSQDQLGLLLSIIEESLGGLRIIKAFNAERYQKAKFSRENRAYANLQTNVFNRRDLSSPLSEFLAIIVVAVILWFGGQMVLDGTNNLTGEMFIGYILIFANLINPAKSLANSA